ARCPGHADDRASLSISAGDDGRTLLHCHAGCALDAILGKVGLTKRDLFSSNGDGRAPTAKREVAVYDYRDEQGDLLFQVVRFDPKDFRQRRPKEGGGWEWKLGDTKRVLFRLPELLAADPAATVFVVEGEKDCDRLAALGLVATTCCGGAGKWRAEYNVHFAGRPVVVLPDADAPGRKHAQQVAAALHGTAASVKVVKLPGIADKGDVSDWLDAGRTTDELTKLVDATPEWAPTAEPVVIGADFPLTDTGLAERFAAKHKENVRYCYPWKSYLVFDGRRWDRDSAAQVEQFAKETVRSILREAADEGDDDARKALVKFARQSESALRRSAMLRLAQSETGIPIKPDVLDRDPWILNCPNGTIDLQTGELRQHRRENYLTKLCPTEYDPAALCPTWLKTLDRCFSQDYELIDFVQRFAGYFLTGDVSEQSLCIWYGVGANGKSTILNSLMEMMGADYSMKAGGDLLMTKRNESHPTALTDLAGRRFIAAIETAEGHKLAETLVKELVGGDPIRARRMREDYWQFDPTHKVVLACNHRPIVRGTDIAIWRRIKLVPFGVVIPPDERDKQLPAKLRDELPGILAWCVRGCLDWQRIGLGEPAAVINATAEYQSAEDVLLNFIGECCTQGDVLVRASNLLAAYKEWSGDKYMTAKRFGRMLNERGVERYTNNGVWYRGIGLTTEG
ncbi:MAG: hypothetical protein KKE86_11670, partial [Planctomycetes bacterium]|nr:hypothetical protein [Planctomycetota bacterium]